MNNDDLWAWQQRHGYTYDSAAAALGMARSTYHTYLQREGNLPRWLMLACRAIDAGLG